MNKLLSTITTIVFLLASNLHADVGDFKGGVELGISPVELKAEETAQQIANLSGSTVTTEYDTGAFVGRIFGTYGVAPLIDVEAGYFRSSSMDATYKIGADSAKESYTASGLDLSANFKSDSGLYGKLGLHSSRIEGAASLTIASTTYSLEDYTQGSSWLAGAGFESNNIRYSWTHYNSVGGDGGANFNVFSVGFVF
jgi:hypothetical protein